MPRGGKREGAGRKPDALKAEAHKNVSAICRGYAPKVIKYLMEVVENKGEKTDCRIKAGTVILERGFGPARTFDETDGGKIGGRLEIVVTDKRADVSGDEQN